jgi:arylsulfatase
MTDHVAKRPRAAAATEHGRGNQDDGAGVLAEIGVAFGLSRRGEGREPGQRSAVTKDRRRYVFFPAPRGSEDAAAAPAGEDEQAPDVCNRSHSIRATLEIPPGGAEGVIAAQGGGAAGGYALYVANRRLVYVHNSGTREHVVTSRCELGEGRVDVRVDVEVMGVAFPREGRGAPALADLYVGLKLVGLGVIPHTRAASAGAFRCGRAGSLPVTKAFGDEFPFTGTVSQVVVEVTSSSASSAGR